MSDLLSRLEALTGPSREVDAEIALAIGWTKVRLGSESCWRQPHSDGGGTFHPQPPCYTQFLDAAVSAVPEDHWWTAGHCKRENHAGCGPEGRGPEQDGFGATPAIALLIAILRARETEGK